MKARRRRGVKIKVSSSRLSWQLFAMILLNCLLLILFSLIVNNSSLAGATSQPTHIHVQESLPPPTLTRAPAAALAAADEPAISSLVGQTTTTTTLSSSAPKCCAHPQTHHLNHHNHHQFASQQQQLSTPTSASNQQQQQQQQLPVVPTISHLCSMLSHHQAKHLKLCKLISHSPQADEAVTYGAARGLAECRQQFKSDRWNCSHSLGDHHLLTSRLALANGLRESGFVQAIASAGIVHSIASACSVGSLSDCACDKTRVGLIRQKDQMGWKWGGCSNNIRHGMMFAKHLVELLDAVHQQQQLQLQLQQQQQQRFEEQNDNDDEPQDDQQQHFDVVTTSHHHHQQQHHLLHHNNNNKRHQHRLGKRSLSSRHRDRNQVRGGVGGGGGNAIVTTATMINADELSVQQPPPQQTSSFCQPNQNITQTTHLQLIKSLLAKNSLEKHQDFRLAMNMHNNKVGRLAVAKNMEIKCRCHGLSGSCSLKTCWLRLPDFQQVGAYLRRKYENSIHLPSAVDLNRLIPMMNKQEISTILSQQSSAPGSDQIGPNWSNDAVSAPPPSAATSSPEFAPLVSVELTTTTTTSGSANSHFNYYERHKIMQASKQLDSLHNSSSSAAAATFGPNVQLKQLQPLTTTTTTTSGDGPPLGLKLNESPNSDHFELGALDVAPLSQQQYRSLLKELKLCGSNTTTTTTTTTTTNANQRSHLATRDLINQADHHHHHQHHHNHHQKQHSTIKSKSAITHQAPPQAVHHSQHHHLFNQLLQAHNKDDLLHLHKSPDYCQADLRQGYPGVQARVCNPDPQAADSCDKLCCGRGHETREVKSKYQCQCQFKFCCYIACTYCDVNVIEHICK